MFDHKSEYLAASSAKKTVHIFRVAQENTTSYFRMMAPVISYCGSEWSFANLSIDQNESYPVISVVNGYVFVITRTGKYYKAVIKSEGGACQIEDTQSVLEDVESLAENIYIS